MLICPICGGALERLPKTFCCEKRHSYDIAAQGYVNLLPANCKSSPNPGDNPEMVNGRSRFLDSGSYAPLSDGLNRMAAARCGSAPRVLDLGCGEGYYTARLHEALLAAGRAPQTYGVDLSKAGVKRAARRCRPAQFFIASLFALPVATGSVELCYNIFSPLCPEELARILVSGGHFLAVYPAARHLFGLKQVLYAQPYENPQESYALPGFSIQEQVRIHYSFTLEDRELIQSLFAMTPYYYKTPREGGRRLAELDRLTTEADFWLVAYRREATE